MVNLPSRWGTKTRQSFSTEKFELSNFLTGDDKMSFTDKHIARADADSVSTFHPVTSSDKSGKTQQSSA
jgi:hypothetical protein